METTCRVETWLTFYRTARVQSLTLYIFILGFCILLRVLHQGYWKNRPSQQLFKVFILYFILLFSIIIYMGTRGSVVVKALCYKPEGRGFDSR
jgi:hypothetical protein